MYNERTGCEELDSGFGKSEFSTNNAQNMLMNVSKGLVMPF